MLSPETEKNMKLNYLILDECLRLWFQDVDTNQGTWHPVPAVSRILCSNVQGLFDKLSDLTVASSQYDNAYYSLRLSQMCMMHYMSEFLVLGFGHCDLLCQSRIPF